MLVGVRCYVPACFGMIRVPYVSKSGGRRQVDGAEIVRLDGYGLRHFRYIQGAWKGGLLAALDLYVGVPEAALIAM